MKRPAVAAAVLLTLYVVLSLFMDPGGYLGTDTGAKVYTLEVMDRADTNDPDIGYWAEEFDPSGRLHPLYQTKREGDSWVAVTTLPMLVAARPLYEAGGYRLALLLPMLGGVGAALAADRLGRQLGGDRGRVFWIVGLASPVAVYSLDLWEHTIGLACVLGAVSLLMDVAQGRTAALGIVAGGLLGGGAVLRNEVLVYTSVAVGAVCITILVRERSLLRPFLLGLATVSGFAVPWFANVALESDVGGQSRVSRTSSASTAATERAASDLVPRIEEAFQTSLALRSGPVAASVLLGAIVVAVLLVAFHRERRGDQRFARLAIVAAAVPYLTIVFTGFGFIPGLFLAFPLAIAGLVQWRRTHDCIVIAAVAVCALPIVYAFQYLGGGGPQWGGRYTLSSALLLGIVGLVRLRDRYPVMAKGLVGLSFAVTALGVAWLGVRSHSVDRFFDDVVEQSEDVVIARQAFLIREGGAVSIDRQWLSTANEQQFGAAVQIARDVGADAFTVLEWDGAVPPDAAIPSDAREVRRDLLDFAGTPVGIVSYEFVGS